MICWDQPQLDFYSQKPRTEFNETFLSEPEIFNDKTWEKHELF